jgi:hypothetical protein
MWPLEWQGGSMFDRQVKPHTQPSHNRTKAEPTQPQCCYLAKKKAPTISRKGLIRLTFLAPRPGLEPGTYGLTEQLTQVSMVRKLKICNEFFPTSPSRFSIPNRKPNLWRRWWLRWSEKSIWINELPEGSVELVKTETADRTGPN